MNDNATGCPRCSECKHSVHHWMNNPDFGNFGTGEDAPDHDPRYTHVCKHCPGLGSECEECDGDGTLWEPSGQDDEGEIEYDPCPICQGDGVITGQAALDETGEPVEYDRQSS